MAMQTTKGTTKTADEAIKQTAQEAIKLHNVNLDDKESIIQHAKGVLKEHTRIEALRLNEEITMRQALMTSLTPEQRERALQHLKMPTIVTAPAAKPDRVTLPFSVIDYRVLRPPFAAYYAVPSPAYNVACVTAGREAGLNRRFAEGVAAEGALSIEAAIGEWFNVECWPDGSWFIGEANQASAAMGLRPRGNAVSLDLLHVPGRAVLRPRPRRGHGDREHGPLRDHRQRNIHPRDVRAVSPGIGRGLFSTSGGCEDILHAVSVDRHPAELAHFQVCHPPRG
jgi:hypothetical protein